MGNLEDFNLDEHCENVQGIFLNLDLSNSEEELKRVEKIFISNKAVTNGIIFVPVLKQNIHRMIKIMKQKKVHFYLKHMGLLSLKPSQTLNLKQPGIHHIFMLISNKNNH